MYIVIIYYNMYYIIIAFYIIVVIIERERDFTHVCEFFYELINILLFLLLILYE